MPTPLTHMRLPPDTLARLDWLAQAHEDQRGRPGNRTAAVVDAVACCESLLRSAAADNARAIEPDEWNLLADVLNGYFWPDPSEPWRWSAALIAAEVEDGHRFNRVGHKWFQTRADARVKRLLRTLHGLDELHVYALRWAIRRFWLRHEWGTDVKWWDPNLQE